MGRREKHSFMEGLARWLEEYDTTSQANSIRQVAAWFAEHAPETLLGQPTLDAARRMQKDLRKAGKSQSTINNRTQVVKRVLSLAFKEWDWLDAPMDGKLRKPTPKNERHVYLTADQVKALILAVPDDYPEERRVITLAALTGLRRGELFSLDPSNIQSGRIVLRPGQTKSGKARIVPLPTDGGYLVENLPFQTDGHQLRKAFEVARKAIGRDDLRFHDLRHTYASMLAEAGEVMTTVQALLGHSSLVVTSRYAHMFDSRLDQVANKLPRICDQTATKGRASEGLNQIKH
ncbi:site-specific recombinase XerD [Modicisalibacter xianhensis]|uniref:Site-specific recombinase XerD n=2 Tax=Modicisalibacter xianhensis TaxID=442341 RepID=A0A4R8FW65_9GAMM|nr:site-specific recombinase XerD [Halomonas xianhensis]